MERGALPSIGVVSVTAEGAVRLTLRAAPDVRGRARVFFERVASFGDRLGDVALLQAPDTIDERDGALVLAYDGHGTVGLVEAAKAWREELSSWLPTVLAVARAVAASGLALERLGWGFLPIAPELLRVRRTACGLAGPGIGSGISTKARWLAQPPFGADLASFAEADPATWALAPPEALLGEHAAPTGYTVGALLHACIAGDLWPELVPAGERLARLLRGRAGDVPSVKRALSAELPKALAAEGAELAETVALLLDPDRSRRPAGDEILTHLGRAAAALTPSALAEGWEREGRPERALAVLDRASRFGPPEDVPWAQVRNFAESVGDLPRALEAGARALADGDPAALRRYMALLGALVAPPATHPSGAGAPPPAPPAPSTLARWIARLDETFPGEPGEAARVYLAHLEARHLGNGEAARARLKGRFASEWCRALAAVLEARTYVEAEQYPRASRAARDGRALFEAAPGGGGHAGTYGRAYLQLLDGIANVGAVEALSDPSFLRDAFGCLTRGLDLARSIGAQDLAASGLAWLAHVREAARPGRDAASPALLLGIDAYLEAHGLADRRSTAPAGGAAARAGARPPIPWYDEATLFPAQVVTT